MKSYVNILKNFVAFLEYMKFTFFVALVHNYWLPTAGFSHANHGPTHQADSRILGNLSTLITLFLMVKLKIKDQINKEIKK